MLKKMLAAAVVLAIVLVLLPEGTGAAIKSATILPPAPAVSENQWYAGIVTGLKHLCAGATNPITRTPIYRLYRMVEPVLADWLSSEFSIQGYERLHHEISQYL